MKLFIRGHRDKRLEPDTVASNVADLLLRNPAPLKRLSDGHVVVLLPTSRSSEYIDDVLRQGCSDSVQGLLELRRFMEEKAGRFLTYCG